MEGNTRIRLIISILFSITFSFRLFVSEAQEFPVPYLLKNGKYTYVKKGTRKYLDKNEFEYVSLYDKNGLSLAYQVFGSGRYVTYNGFLKDSNCVNIFTNTYNAGSLETKITKAISPLYFGSKAFYIYSSNGDGDNVYKKLIDNQGKELIKDVSNIQSMDIVSEDRLIGYYGYPSYSYALLDTNGNLITSPTIKKFGTKFSNNLISYYYSDDKCGYMDKDANEVIFAQYRNCEIFTMGFARVQNQNYGYEYINKKGEKLNIDGYINGVIGSKNYKLIILDTGNVINASGVNLMVVLHNDFKKQNLILTLLDEKFKLISTTVVPNYSFDIDYEHFEVGLLLKNIIQITNRNNYLSYVVNYKTKKVVHFATSSEFNGIGESTVPFKDVNGWGYKNFTSNVVIEPKYYLATPFKYRHALVKDIRGWHLIKESGEKILSLGKNYDQSILEIYAPGLIKCTLPIDYSNRYLPEKYFLVGFDGFEYFEK